MPIIKRQTPPSSPRYNPPSESGGVLSRIQPVGETVDEGMKINLYGRNGSGKTTLSCTFPKPLLLVGCEDGTKSVRNVEGVEFVLVRHTSELHEIATFLKSPEGLRKYRTVVLDTATSLQDLVLKEIMGLSEMPVQLAWGMVSRDQYTHRSEKTKEILRLYLDLRMNVVITAQEKNHTNTREDGSVGAEEGILAPFVAASLGASACAWLQENVDYICQTYTREGYSETEHRVGGKSVSMKEKTGKIEFCLRTQRAHPVFGAKMRADRSIELPDVIVDPSWDKLIAAINGQTNVS